jgi:hypothetical protein
MACRHGKQEPIAGRICIHGYDNTFAILWLQTAQTSCPPRPLSADGLASARAVTREAEEEWN